MGGHSTHGARPVPQQAHNSHSAWLQAWQASARTGWARPAAAPAPPRWRSRFASCCSGPPGLACTRSRPARAPRPPRCPACPPPRLQRGVSRWVVVVEVLVRRVCWRDGRGHAQRLHGILWLCTPLPDAAALRGSPPNVGLSTYWMSARERSCTSYRSGRQYVRPLSTCKVERGRWRVAGRQTKLGSPVLVKQQPPL